MNRPSPALPWAAMTWLFALLISGLPAEGELVARVNGEPITFGAFVQELIRSHGPQTLEKLIWQKAIETEMKKTGVQVSSEEIERELVSEREAIALQYGPQATLEEFIGGRLNMGLEEYKDRVLRLRVFAMKLLRPKIDRPSDAKLAVFFTNNEDRYSVPEKRRISHILVYSVDPKTRRPRSEEEISILLGRVKEELRSGKDFAKVARRLSEDESTRRRGGDIGWMDARGEGEGGPWARALRDAAFSLAEGQVGRPVPSPYGRHFLRVTDVFPGKKLSFEAVEKEVRKDYVEEQLRLRSERWALDLARNAKVERLYEPAPGRSVLPPAGR